MSRKLIIITLLLVSTTLWFIEFGYFWNNLSDTVVLYILAIIIISIWALNASILYVILKLFPLATLNPPIPFGPMKKPIIEDEASSDQFRSRFSVAQEFTTFGLCIAALLWLLRMVLLDEDGY